MKVQLRRPAGFTLIEVMVALIVLSVGLLGIARMQTFALSSTSVSSKRSLAAIQAAGLAALMHENRGYWTVGEVAGSVYTMKGSTVNSAITIGGVSYAWSGAPALLAAGFSCSSACSPTQMAAYDLQTWATNLNKVLPNASVLIQCGTVTPVGCELTISWAENAVGVTKEESDAAAAAATAGTPAALQVPTFTIYIEP
jgi:type IV pilus assembly protein PilV